MNFKRHVKIREEKFGGVIFDTLKEKVFITNETGRDIVELIQKGESAEGIVDSLAERYDVSNDEIKDDSDRFILQLKENGILE